MVLSQVPSDLAGEDVSGERRRDGVWVTVPDLSDVADVTIGETRVTGHANAPIRADVSLRSRDGLGKQEPKTRQLQATVHARSVDALLPEVGQTVLTAEGGASGRVALSSRGLSSAIHDRLLAVIGDVAQPAWRATSVGVYRLWRDAGYVAGALLAGITADAFGVPVAMRVVAALTFLSGVVVASRMSETHPVEHAFA